MVTSIFWKSPFATVQNAKTNLPKYSSPVKHTFNIGECFLYFRYSNQILSQFVKSIYALLSTMTNWSCKVDLSILMQSYFCDDIFRNEKEITKHHEWRYVQRYSFSKRTCWDSEMVSSWWKWKPFFILYGNIVMKITD